MDKPAGMTVHNDPGKDLCYFVSKIIASNDPIRRQIKPDTAFGVHPVHRLDKQTSGVLLLAADPESFRFFSTQFASRNVTKIYLALLHGRLKAPPKNEPWGTWEWPLTKTAGGRSNPRGFGKKRPSQTHFRVLGYSSHYTMAELIISTGRKHQIRRHAKTAGHPVVGDNRYGSTRATKFLKSQFSFSRLGLHAKSISIIPAEGKSPKTISSPKIPVDMKTLFERDINEGKN